MAAGPEEPLCHLQEPGGAEAAASHHADIPRAARSVQLASSPRLLESQEDLFQTLRLSSPCFLDTHIRRGQPRFMAWNSGLVLFLLKILNIKIGPSGVSLAGDDATAQFFLLMPGQVTFRSLTWGGLRPVI